MKNQIIRKQNKNTRNENGRGLRPKAKGATGGRRVKRKDGCRRCLWTKRVELDEALDWWNGLSMMNRVCAYWTIAVLREANADEAIYVAGLVREWFAAPGERKGLGEPGHVGHLN